MEVGSTEHLFLFYFSGSGNIQILPFVLIIYVAVSRIAALHRSISKNTHADIMPLIKPRDMSVCGLEVPLQIKYNELNLGLYI